MSAARLVGAGTSDIAHPLDHLVIGVVELRLEHLQVAHLKAGRSERDL